MGTRNVRIPDDLLGRLDRLAHDEGMDRSTMLCRALERGSRSIALDRAIRSYQRGGLTAWKAARDEETPLLRFLEELDRRGVRFRTDEETLRSQLEQNS